MEKFPRDTNMADMTKSLLLQFQEMAEARERMVFLPDNENRLGGFIGRPIRGSPSHLLGCKEVTTPKIFSHLSLIKRRRMRGALFPLPYTPSEFIAWGIK